MRQCLVSFFACLVVLLSGVVRAEDIYALTVTNSLVRVSTDNPALVISSVAITGLQSGESLVGIDFRPNTGQLFGVGNSSRVYIINVTSGVATAVGATPFSPVLLGTAFGVDFNPTVDRIRVVSDTGQSLRLNPNDGTVAGDDTVLAYAQLDPSFGAVPRVVASAYSDNFPGSTTTTLYSIDSTQDTLVTQGSLNAVVSPNGGALFTVGKLGVNTGDLSGLDISGGTGTAYASLTLTGETSSKLYSINVFSGTASLQGTIGIEQVRDISAVTAPTTFDVVALRTNNTIVRFDSRTPSIVTNSVSVTGLQAAENLLAIDYRPANGVLYALGSTSRLYTLNPISGAAVQVGTGPFTPVLTGANFGFDFNPVVDRIRVVGDDEQNLRLNPDTAVVTADTALAYVAGDPNFTNVITGIPNPSVVGAAYTNSAAGATTTALFAIDSGSNALAVIGSLDGAISPNTGQLRTIGALGVNTNVNVGFDIRSTGVTTNGNAFAVLSNNFYTIHLPTGAATQVGTLAIGGGTAIRDIALTPPANIATIQFSAASFSVIEKNTAVLSVTRTGGTQGPVSVDYAITGGTATAGVDYTPAEGTLVFVDGETTRTILIPALDDTTLELFETVTFTLKNPVGSVLGTQVTARLDIADKDDLDGDGFINALETLFGSTTTDAASTPFNGAAAGVAQPLLVTKASIKLNFLKPLSDSISFSGELPFPVGFTPFQKQVIVNIGGINGIIKVFNLDAKGKSTPKSNETFAIGLKPKNGLSKYAVKLSKNTYRDLLAEEGFTAATDLTKTEKPLQIDIYFNNVNYRATKTFLYSSKKGKSGSATLAKVQPQ